MLKHYVLNNILFIPVILITQLYLSKKYNPVIKYRVCNMICILMLLPNNIFYAFQKTNYDFANKIYVANQNIDIRLNNSVSINPTIDKSQLLYDIWLIGVIIYLVFYIFSHMCFRSRSLNFSKEVSKEIILLLDKVKLELNINKTIQIRYSYFIKTPLLTGFFKQIILLPYNIKKDYLYLVFKHELYHYKHKDLFLQGIRLIVRCVYWFNPFVWLLCKQSNKYMEMACDHYVINKSNVEQTKKYANALLDLIDTNKSIGTGFNKSDIYYRMEYIMSKKTKKNGFLFALTIALCSIFISFGANAQLIKANNYYSNSHIPIVETFKDLGYKVTIVNKNLIEVVKDSTKINFIAGQDINLKKDKTTYFMNVLEDNYFVKIKVLEDLGYKITTNKNDLYIKDNVLLDTEKFGDILLNNSTRLKDETQLKNSYFLDHSIVKENIKDLINYTIYDKNLLGYKSQELENYIKANYNKTIVKYRADLIDINKKYPAPKTLSYDLLDNGQVMVKVIDSNAKIFIELAIEVRDSKVFVEK